MGGRGGVWLIHLLLGGGGRERGEMWLTGSSSSGCRITNCLQSNPLIDVTNITVTCIFIEHFTYDLYAQNHQPIYRKDYKKGCTRVKRSSLCCVAHCENNFVILRLLTSLNIITWLPFQKQCHFSLGLLLTHSR